MKQNSRRYWLERFERTREETKRLVAPLSAEDQQLQASPDASPTKWHQAHTTWFFETFLLQPSGVPPVSEQYQYLFNSYYESIGPRHPRPQRGLVSRPSLREVEEYRRLVNEQMLALLKKISDEAFASLVPVLALGIAHEEQHQELILTDILAAFATHSFHPVYIKEVDGEQGTGNGVRAETIGEIQQSGNSYGFTPHFSLLTPSLVTIGAQPEEQFYFDNEGPQHKVFLGPYMLSTKPILVQDVLTFIEAKGYETPVFWLSEGWSFIQQNKITSPGYSFVENGALWVFTLHGLRCAAPEEPASHLSYYEADAIARFLEARLPTEAEWEHAARSQPLQGQFREQGLLVPKGDHLFGGVWEWTSSSYSAYPGYSPGIGALGEYNGKFMVNQMVLRGGSCFSNKEHLRPSYRNFWHPHTRFQMTGARIARDIK
jgi:ergothioneine biosynthesis protein EgtB